MSLSVVSLWRRCERFKSADFNLLIIYVISSQTGSIDCADNEFAVIVDIQSPNVQQLLSEGGKSRKAQSTSYADYLKVV